eukprot:GHVT01100746.1.p1 GENE.GHVT01100746.1~~GHVT01100746.1.p1  ORF type:complete len:116 (+),score=9.47 GHVT01100746.1:309-656(+)
MVALPRCFEGGPNPSACALDEQHPHYGQQHHHLPPRQSLSNDLHAPNHLEWLFGGKGHSRPASDGLADSSLHWCFSKAGEAVHSFATANRREEQEEGGEKTAGRKSGRFTQSIES